MDFNLSTKASPEHLRLHYLRLGVLCCVALFFLLGSFFCVSYAPHALAENKSMGHQPTHTNQHPLKVITLIEPYRLIVNAVLHEIRPESRPLVEVTTLITQPISAHHASLKPSQRIALKQADVVIVSRLADELALKKTIENTNAVIIDVSTLQGLIRHPARNNSIHSHSHIHATDKEHVTEDEQSTNATDDTHFWFEPHNAELIGTQFLEILQTKYPEKKPALIEARQQFQQKITAQKKQWQEQLRPLQAQHFLMFHDAYQYLEKWADFKQVHWLTETNEHLITPKKWIQIEKMLRNKEIHCIISSAETTEAFEKLQHKHGAHSVKGIAIDDIARDYSYDLKQKPLQPSDPTYFDWFNWLIQKLLDCAPTATSCLPTQPSCAPTPL
jgi:zinc transport system substrate-binding protein